MATRVVREVELGFVEVPEDPQLLTSAHFPSKAGGKPAWLDPSFLPTPEDLACGSCGKQMTFLLQIYAPLPVDEANPDGDELPRTVFVFMCRNPHCHSWGVSKCFKVMQCQFALRKDGQDPVVNGGEEDKTIDATSLSAEMRDLSLDSAESPIITRNSAVTSSLDALHSDVLSSTNSAGRDAVHNGADTQVSMSHSHLSLHLCIVCGCSGPKRCGRCAQVYYCSKEHQTHDWIAGHKNVCRDLSSGKMDVGSLKYSPSKGILLPEYEIVTELEPDCMSLGNGKPERSEEDRMADYHKFIKSGKCVDGGKGGTNKLSAKALKDAAMSEHNTDKQFRVFKKRVALEPEQVSKIPRGSGRERGRKREENQRERFGKGGGGIRREKE